MGLTTEARLKLSAPLPLLRRIGVNGLLGRTASYCA